MKGRHFQELARKIAGKSKKRQTYCDARQREERGNQPSVTSERAL